MRQAGLERYDDDMRAPAANYIQVVVVGPMKNNTAGFGTITTGVSRLHIAPGQNDCSERDAMDVSRNALARYVVEATGARQSECRVRSEIRTRRADGPHLTFRS